MPLPAWQRARVRAAPLFPTPIFEGEDEGEGSEVCDRGWVGQPLSTWMDAAGPESWMGETVLERVELMIKAATWMRARGWKAKLAEKRGYKKSLFELSLIARVP